MSFQYAANVYLQGSTFNISGRDQIVNNYLNCEPNKFARYLADIDL